MLKNICFSIWAEKKETMSVIYQKIINVNFIRTWAKIFFHHHPLPKSALLFLTHAILFFTYIILSSSFTLSFPSLSWPKSSLSRTSLSVSELVSLFVCSLTPPKRGTPTSWNFERWFPLGLGRFKAKKHLDLSNC